MEKKKIEIVSEDDVTGDHISKEEDNNSEKRDEISDENISFNEKSISDEVNLKKELEEAKSLANQNWESFLRARADYENFKKRAEQQISAGTITGKRIIIDRVIEVLDNFERALNFDESKADVKNILIGVRMIYKQLKGVLEDEGVKEIPTTGTIFDPRFHEAVETVTSDKHKDEEIVEECLKGYTFKDNVLRPAQVKVARVSADTPEDN
jgi:molecular chaperone GrpE